MAHSNRIAPDMEDFDLADDPDEIPDTEKRQQNARSKKDGASQRTNAHFDSDGLRRIRRKRIKDEPQNNPLSLLRDQRLHLGIGIILCVAAIVSTIMCISFISSNVEDQSATLGRTATEIVENNDTITNIGKAIGAKIAQLMMVDLFGIGSFVLAFYFFMLGLACMRVKKISFWSLSFRCFFTTVAISVIIGLLTINQAATFPLGGVHGQYINQLLIDYSGALGAFAVSVILTGLLVAVYLHPIKALIALLKRAVPQRQVPGEKNGNDDNTEKVGTPDLDQLEQPVPETRTIGPDEDVENADEISDETVSTESDRTTPLPDLSQLGEDEGFAIDEPATSDTPAVTVPIESFAKTQFIPLPEEIQSKDNSAIPNEPEMIINAPVAESEDERATILDGDHIGLSEPFDPRAEHSAYVFPPTDLLLERNVGVEINQEEQAANKQMIVNALRSYNIEIVRIEATIGPTVTLYEIVPAEGIRIAKIKSLEDDIAMSLSALGIRIIAPIPGRGTIGIEVPNRKKQIVPMRRIIESPAFRNNRTKMNLPVALGSTISNEVFIEDLAKMPHLLVAGATGQGKSVGLNCIITSLLYSKHPDELKFILVDPKMVEFSLYRSISNAYMAKLPQEDNAIITDPQKVVATLNSLCVEMDRRYELLSDALVRDVVAYNERFTQRRLNPEKGHRYMPYIVVIVDEFADLITTAGKDISVPIARIAQKGRAAGMHMIIATQRPSTDIITGMIKANFPARIAFRVLSSIDSKTILDRPGAHRLIGRGDMLTLINGGTERVQCAFVDTEEIEAICDHIARQPGFTAPYELPEVPDENNGAAATVDVNLRNEEFNRCALYIASQTQASITVLQRKFQIGFNKAGRYMDQMEALGIVGPANGAKPRQVLMTTDEVQRIIAEG